MCTFASHLSLFYISDVKYKEPMLGPVIAKALEVFPAFFPPKDRRIMTSRMCEH